MILSPFSYELITEQIVGNQTKESIVTSYLPKAFFAKKGEREIIRGNLLCDTKEMKLFVHTLPFLVIISDIDYKYNNVSTRVILMSTPLENIEIMESDLNNIYDYISDTAKYLEVKLDESDTCIYQKAHENIEKNVLQIFTDSAKDAELIKILGGKEGGYGNILKKVNGLITPVDPISKHIENK